MAKSLGSEKARLLRRQVSANLDLVVEIILNRTFWPKDVDRKVRYTRMSDDNHGVLNVSFSDDGDGWVDVIAKPDPNQPGSMRFRTAIGGGTSPRVRQALLILAAAIRLDELEHPQDRSKLDLGKTP